MIGQRCIICYAAWAFDSKSGAWSIRHKRTCLIPNRVQYIERGIWSMKSYGNAGSRTPVSWSQSTRCICLGVPKHSQDCPGKDGVIVNPLEWVGPDVMRKYYEELDGLVDILIDSKPHELSEEDADHTRGKAEAIAWCIAMLQNQVEPNVDAVRRESMRRREMRTAASNGAKPKRKVKA